MGQLILSCPWHEGIPVGRNARGARLASSACRHHGITCMGTGPATRWTRDGGP